MSRRRRECSKLKNAPGRTGADGTGRQFVTRYDFSKKTRLSGDCAHFFKNIGTNPGVLLFGVTPGGFEKMFAERQGVGADTNKRLMEKYHMQVAGPPLP